MTSRRRSEQATPESLPIRTHCVLGANGARSVALRVFCPERATTTSVDVCERCEQLDRIETDGDSPSVHCRPDSGQVGRERVGALVRASVICARSDLPLDDLEADQSDVHVIPVVDDALHYIGAVVHGRARSTVPPPRESDTALLRGHATVEDAMEHMQAVNENDDIVTARCIAVVNDEHAVVGLLDDLALLASAARAHGRR